MLNKTKIFIADDHQLIVAGLKVVLKKKQNFEVVGFSNNGVNLIEKVLESKADVLIMDISMPEKTGFEVMMELKQYNVPFKTIILSSHEELQIVKELLNFGASAYITKTCAFEVIIEAIENVLVGKTFFCDTIQNKMNTFFSEENFSEIQSLDSAPLSCREVQVLKLIAKGNTGKKIGELLNISIHTVESHRKNIQIKLHIKTSIGLVKYAITNNLIES